MNIKTKLLRALAMVHDPEDSRALVQSIHFVDGKAYATNGHVMLTVDTPDCIGPLAITVKGPILKTLKEDSRLIFPDKGIGESAIGFAAHQRQGKFYRSNIIVKNPLFENKDKMYSDYITDCFKKMEFNHVDPRAKRNGEVSVNPRYLAYVDKCFNMEYKGVRVSVVEPHTTVRIEGKRDDGSFVFHIMGLRRND